MSRWSGLGGGRSAFTLCDLFGLSSPVFPAPSRAADPALPIRFSYSPQCPAVDDQRLAAFAYGTEPVAEGAVHVPMALPHGGMRYELWHGSGSVTHRSAHGARIAEDGRVLVASWQFDEAAYGGIEAAAEYAYRGIGALLADSGYPHPVKVWHYFGAINEGAGDAERYRRFCVGRARGIPAQLPLPAATAIGVQAEPDTLTVILIAAKEPGQRLENPRQVPAYEYPRDYGPASPSFARAMAMPWGQLFVSGTAAIIGHESCHPENAGAQLRELALNLDALVARAESRSGHRLTPTVLKIFLRRAEDYATIDALSAQLFPADCSRIIVLADICRAELQVEVEALYQAV